VAVVARIENEREGRHGRGCKEEDSFAGRGLQPANRVGRFRDMFTLLFDGTWELKTIEIQHNLPVPCDFEIPPLLGNTNAIAAISAR
jgi:hypothetical protein